MKHLLTLAFAIALMLPLQQAHAQEKQSDATWAETRSFINKYKNYIDTIDYDIYFYNKYNVRQSIYNPKIDNFFITENFWVNLKIEANDSYTSRGGDDYYTTFNYSISFNLYYLDVAEVEGNVIRLYTTGNQINYEEKARQEKNYKYFESETEEFKRNYLRVRVPDDEMRPRLLKAFQHLAYLANAKREEDRLKSGDAF